MTLREWYCGSMTSIAQNLETVKNKIAEEARACGRNPDDIHILAVSKKQPIERIKAALEAGHRLFGENRVQEAQNHWQDLKSEYPDLKLHMVGPLQTNKIKDAVALFDCIETLDREKLARKLADEMAAQDRDLPCFIQVNTGEEPQKSGILPDSTAEFHDFCRYECGINVKGLMCIPPLEEPPAPHFALIQKLGLMLGLTDFSMGMSADFEKAISLGATYVRIGTEIFGERV